MTATLDRYAVLGNPVAHSRSPAIHAAFALQTGEAIEYGRVLSPLDGFEASLRAFTDGGGRGCNVTLPFKFDAFRLATRRSARAELAGAANVLRFDSQGWFADNSDGVGLVRDIEVGAGVALAGQRVLLIGAGGAAAGVLGPLLAARPAALVVVNRTASKAEELVTSHAGWALDHDAALAAAPLASPGQLYDVVINATASSLQGVASPVPAAVLAPGALAVDLMYGAPAEPFLAWARNAGASARDGLGMLVEQAAEAFFLWRGVRPQTAPVLHALRQDNRPMKARPAGLRHGARIVALLVLSTVALQLVFVLRIALMTVVDPQSTTFQRSEAWRLAVEKHQITWAQQWVPRTQISPQLQRAVLASEDAGFATHGGVEWGAIEKAWGRNQVAEARVQRQLQRQPERTVTAKVVGGSTITQQLAKNLLLSGERTVLRKAQELLLTLALEALLSKQRILEIYLNNVEWGEGLFGAQAAARNYFRVDAARLGPEQAARLAVMLPAPKRFEKRPASAYVLGRSATIVARMPGVDLP